jgi:hypothetical protein
VRDDPEQSTTFHVLTVTNLALVSSYSAIVAFASVLRSQNRPHPCFRDSESEHLIFFPKKQKMIRSSLTLHNKISHLYLGNCQDSLVHSLDHFLFHSSGCSLPIFKLLFRVTPKPTAVWLLCWLSVWCSSFLTSGCCSPSDSDSIHLSEISSSEVRNPNSTTSWLLCPISDLDRHSDPSQLYTPC